EVLGIEFPTDQQSAAPLNPREEAFDEPSPLISTPPAAVQGERPHAVRTIRSNHLDALSAQFFVKDVTVVSAVADEVFGLGLDHVEVEAEPHQTYFVAIRCMRAHRERQTMAIHNRHDLRAFPTSRRADLRTAALSHRKRRVDKTLLFIERPALAKLIGDICQN